MEHFHRGSTRTRRAVRGLRASGVQEAFVTGVTDDVTGVTAHVTSVTSVTVTQKQSSQLTDGFLVTRADGTLNFSAASTRPRRLLKFRPTPLRRPNLPRRRAPNGLSRAPSGCASKFRSSPLHGALKRVHGATHRMNSVSDTKNVLKTRSKAGVECVFNALWISDCGFNRR